MRVATFVLRVTVLVLLAIYLATAYVSVGAGKPRKQIDTHHNRT